MDVNGFFDDFSRVPNDKLDWLKWFVNKTIRNGSILPRRSPDTWFLKNELMNVYEEFQEKTQHLTGFSFGDRLKLLFQGYWDIGPVCKYCGNLVKILDQYPYTPRPFCSRSCSSRHEESKDKSRKLWISKYGVDNPSKCLEIKNKIKNSYLQKYGVDNISQLPYVKEKKIQTCMRNYGVENGFQVGHRSDFKHISDNTVKCISSKEWLFDQYITKRKSGKDIARHLDVTSTAVLNRCRTHGFDIRQHSSFSSYESKMVEFLQDIINDIKIIQGSRNILPNKHELDIYLPEYRLAIEINGLYWHKGKSETYHQDKKLECEKLDIDLIMVTDRDMDDERRWKIIQSMIKSRLNKNKKIGARKCKFHYVPGNVAKEFMNENHISGFCPATVHCELSYNNEVVMIASFGKPRLSKCYDWELIRLATKSGVSIIGGISKIISNFQKDNSGTLLSYIDLDYFSSDAAKAWAGNKIKITSPGYFWTDGKQILSRYQTQKRYLKKILGLAIDTAISETYNIMQKSGFDKYYNCGNAVYTLEPLQRLT